MMRHFLSLLDVSAEEIEHLLKEAVRLKKAHLRGKFSPALQGRLLGLIFEKPSLRTRVSFEAAMAQMGGASFFFSGQEAQLGVRESLADFARTISQYVDAVVLRTFRHQVVEEFSQYASCPVINGLSDYFHPCQALGDLLTIQELFGGIAGRTVVFVGDGNNVARSLAVGCGLLGARFILSGPKGYGFDPPFLQSCQKLIPAGNIQEISDPKQAVRQADVLYTDVWASMGQEGEAGVRRKKFHPYQVNAALLNHAPARARFMHCLPAHRGEEVTEEVLESDRSVVFQQAANRLHAQKALLKWLLVKGA